MTLSSHTPVSLASHPGVHLYSALLDAKSQRALMEDIGQATKIAPLFRPTMPKSGKPFSVQMSNCGPLGWVSDTTLGYRYQPHHPISGEPWPLIPAKLLQLWDDLTAYPLAPEACLVNYYRHGARMGLHQDRDEEDLGAPVLSISLGDSAVYRLGGTTRGGKTLSFRLNSGDVLVMGGASRLVYHGVDRILTGSSTLLVNNGFLEGGRINLTLRRVTKA